MSSFLKEKERLREIIKKEALTFGEITLSSGLKSNFYVDGKLVTLSPEGSYLTAKLFLQLLEEEEVEAVGGLTLGADPIATAIATLSFVLTRQGKRDKPVKAFLVRKSKKTHGGGKQIEGPLKTKDRVVLVEDVVTTGGSALEAARVVEEFGCQVLKVLALVDRQQGGREAIEAKGYRFEAIFTAEDLGITVEE